MNQTVKLFTHTDLDGIGCAILAKLAFGDDVDIAYCDYENINDKVEDFLSSGDRRDICLITDISVSDETAKIIDMSNDKYCLLDHHSTALGLKEYSWCTVEIESHKLEIKTSGTELFYQWLVENDFLIKKVSLDVFVEIVRDYDTWRWSTLGENGIICKQINDLLYIYGREKFIERCLSKINEGTCHELDLLEDTLLKSHQREIDNYIKKKDKEIIFSENKTRSVGR